MTDGEMVIYLHDVASKTRDAQLHFIADRFEELRPNKPGAIMIDRSEEARDVFSKKIGFDIEEN